MQYKIIKKEAKNCEEIIRDVVRYGKPPKSGCIATTKIATTSGWTIWGIPALRKTRAEK